MNGFAEQLIMERQHGVAAEPSDLNNEGMDVDMDGDVDMESIATKGNDTVLTEGKYLFP